MVCAISTEAWQVIGIWIAALAAIASWASVVVAARAAKNAREAQREAAWPNLLLAPAFVTSGPIAPTMTISVHNAGGGIAQSIGLLLVTDDAFAYHRLDFVRPGETIYFGSDVPAAAEPRAVVFGRSADGEGFAWNANAERRRIATAPAPLPSFIEVFAEFYPDEDVEENRELGQLLRASNTLY